MTETRNALRLPSAAYSNGLHMTPVDMFIHQSPLPSRVCIHEPRMSETSNIQPPDDGIVPVDGKNAHEPWTPIFTNGGSVSVSARTTDRVFQPPATPNTRTSTPM